MERKEGERREGVGEGRGNERRVAGMERRGDGRRGEEMGYDVM